jgi:CRISPR/Cas system-associated protein Csm6
MLTLQEIIVSIDNLPVNDQQYLFEVLRQKQEQPRTNIQENNFWSGLQKFRQTIEREGIVFTDEDFADLRDRSPGREVDL